MSAVKTATMEDALEAAADDDQNDKRRGSGSKIRSMVKDIGKKLSKKDDGESSDEDEPKADVSAPFRLKGKKVSWSWTRQSSIVLAKRRQVPTVTPETYTAAPLETLTINTSMSDDLPPLAVYENVPDMPQQMPDVNRKGGKGKSKKPVSKSSVVIREVNFDDPKLDTALPRDYARALEDDDDEDDDIINNGNDDDDDDLTSESSEVRSDDLEGQDIVLAEYQSHHQKTISEELSQLESPTVDMQHKLSLKISHRPSETELRDKNILKSPTEEQDIVTVKKRLSQRLETRPTVVELTDKNIYKGDPNAEPGLQAQSVEDDFRQRQAAVKSILKKRTEREWLENHNVLKGGVPDPEMYETIQRIRKSETAPNLGESPPPDKDRRILFIETVEVIPTFRKSEYSRRPDANATFLHLNNRMKKQIREELNEFKKDEMLVHELSQGNTVFH